MALKATIFKANLQISDLNRNYYHQHQLILARHPSENNHRMMLRLLAFCMYADESLYFTKGVSSADEPDLWRKNLANEIELWIDLGCPEESRIRKACGISQRMVILCYAHSTPIWWKKSQRQLERFENLKIFDLHNHIDGDLEAMVDRNMDFQCTLADGQLWLSNEIHSVSVHPQLLFSGD